MVAAVIQLRTNFAKKEYSLHFSEQGFSKSELNNE